MEVRKEQNGESVTYIIKGSLDPNTSVDLMNQIDLEGVKEIIFDIKDVDYVFSAGLRIFLQIRKLSESEGFKMKIIHASESVKNIFDMVGFSKIIDFE